MDTNLIETMEMITYMVCTSLGKFLVICYATPAFILAIIPTVFIFRYTQKYFSPSMRAMERLESKTKGPIYSFFSETLAGTVVIRAYKAQQRFLQEFQRRYDLHHTVILNWVCCNKWLHVRIQFIMYMVLTSVTLIAVAYKDTVSSGIIGLAVFQASDITFCLHRLVHSTGWVQTQLISVDRVQQYCTLKTEADWRKEDTKPSASWPEDGEVKADDLAVRYREGLDLVLKGVDLRIRAGEKVGIVGRTGAGKSSLTLALFRLLEPARGEFRIDDVSINDLGLHDLRTRLTILPQDPVIFAGTLRMNLDPFAQFTDADVWEALRHAHLSDFISGLKEGLKHECGEGGENLSVGQRQLLCLARTLLHKTRVLVLDEATAAVDMETDDLIQKTIRSEFKECTVLTIAHRLNTVIDYDKILVLDQGQVVEFDSPTNLMDNPSSIFHDMCKKAGLLHKRPRS